MKYNLIKVKKLYLKLIIAKFRNNDNKYKLKYKNKNFHNSKVKNLRFVIEFILFL